MATALIVYASLTGNTEEIADILAEALEERGVEVRHERMYFSASKRIP